MRELASVSPDSAPDQVLDLVERDGAFIFEGLIEGSGPSEVARGLPERVQQLLGYQTANPVLGFADGCDNELQTRPGNSEEQQVEPINDKYQSKT